MNDIYIILLVCTFPYKISSYFIQSTFFVFLLEEGYVWKSEHRKIS